MHDTLSLLKTSGFPSIRRNNLETLQINLGYLCNQTCLHCHVNAGPARREIMSRETISEVVDFLRNNDVKIVDLTGGAPEMNPQFRDLVITLTKMGIKVIDRCNLTILHEPGYEDMASFLAQHKVEIVASMPCYLQDNVDRQRGTGVFSKSIATLKLLNRLGYGQQESGLILNLVYNPQGAVLPPSQNELEIAYKRHLKEEYDVVFDRLFTITNMPIQRFGSTLVSKGQFEEYMQLLRDNYLPENLPSVMCRSTLSVDWQGYVYDCDFNQMLKIPTPAGRRQLRDLTAEKLFDQPITVLDHCYGCTAGQGSSCGGAL